MPHLMEEVSPLGNHPSLYVATPRLNLYHALLLSAKICFICADHYRTLFLSMNKFVLQA